MAYMPRFTITAAMAADMMRIQAAASVIDLRPLPAGILQELRRESLAQTVVLSTKIEGNLLPEPRKRAAITAMPRDHLEQEVHNLAKALDFLDAAEERNRPITVEMIKQLHAVVRVIGAGRRSRLSEYRTLQNKVGDSGSGAIVYLPPEPQDVPGLMEDLVAWVNGLEAQRLPGPIRAGAFMYQFLTIHPYLDGNGRTARLLATYILRRAGLGLRGLFVLERYYDRNLPGYYESLQMGMSHNYYFGRNDADITPWLEFFIVGLAEVFGEAAAIVRAKSDELLAPEPELLRRLDIHQKQVFSQLALRCDRLTTSEIGRLTGLADRTVREKLKAWIAEGFVQPADPSAQRVRSVTLTSPYAQLAVEVAHEPKRFQYLLG